MKTTLIASSVVFSCAVVSMGCASDMKSSTSGYDEGRTSNRIAPASLYDRLGGKPAITAVIDDFVGRVAADNRINGKFVNAKFDALVGDLVESLNNFHVGEREKEEILSVLGPMRKDIVTAM